ncbi:uncharacterized protein Dwil_GK12886 [Drosophila willistoni]|uniref:Aminopeptidase n=1 Tax=Drosophila willistoni TaxID=7260 RepID=B4NJ08_DROWI|nr:endoplasmic reticulum aminopeptidase 1 [Drosophila willistoni]EDW84910.1 uncharacterized protein Dwil_GK12886 [Drosophila willistoni]
MPESRAIVLYWAVILTLLTLWLELGVAGTLPTHHRPLRLPNETYPLSYQLHINSSIHMGNFLFNGNATIDIEIRQSTNEIVLHAKNLSDFRITVLRLNDDAAAIGAGAAEFELVDDLTHTFDSHGSFLVIYPFENYQAFEAGQRYRVEILYTGEMQKKARGLYWMTYENELDNRTVYVAATQSEPTYARMIFPCYDEPAIKSNFSIRLTHSGNYIAISNMPVKELIRHNADLTTTSFLPTPPMSTYLVAFVISDFEHISTSYRGITQSVYSSPTLKEKGQYALKNAVLTVSALEDYFSISYPLEKLDHVALNKNFGAAMENWGLITYKEDNLLSQEKGDLFKRVKDKITQNHEIVHQWFGNLVSPEWWSYAWMNEGFASYFSYVITDMLYPELKVMDFFADSEADRAYSYNSFLDVRPMTSYVETEAEIVSAFDIITYKRAACVIKMFHHAFHRKTFVSGISGFLSKYQYSVANELNLFDCLQTAVLQDGQFPHQLWTHKVREIMLSWTHSEWMPIVSVIRNYQNNTITFRQRSIHSKSEHWWIPLNFATTQQPSFEQTHAEYFMPPQTQHTISLEDLKLQLNGSDWLIVNKQQTGFYHVHYDNENLQAIARQLQTDHTQIHPVNRAALIQDINSLIEHNAIESMNVVLEMLKYMEFEQDLRPWKSVSDTIPILQKNLFGTPSYTMFLQFVRRLVTPMFKSLFGETNGGQVNETVFESGEIIIHIACAVDLAECLDYTHRQAMEYFFNKVHIDNYNIYDTMLCFGTKYLNDDEFEQALKMLQSIERESAYADDMLYSLRCIQSHSHLLHYLEFLMGENSTHHALNDNEAMMYLPFLYKSNLEGRSVIWQFIDRNYKLLCRSPTFVEHFNEIAEFLPQHQRAYFETLREKIATHLRHESLNSRDILINSNSNNVGKKMRNSELFLEKFEHEIHKWLLNEIPQSEDVFAASLSVSNGSSRSEGVLQTANRLVQRALHSNILL